MNEKPRAISDIRSSRSGRSQTRMAPSLPIGARAPIVQKEDRFNPYLSQKIKIHQQEKSPRKSKIIVRSSMEMKPSTNDHSRYEAVFDSIANLIMEGGEINEAFETELQVLFNASLVLFYQDVMAVQSLYCPTKTKLCPHGSGIAGYCHFSRQILNIPNASNHVSYNASYDSAYDSSSRILAFPLFDYQDRIQSVIIISREPDQPSFSTEDEKCVAYFQRKVQLYSRWIFEPRTKLNTAQELIHITRVGPFIEYITDRLSHYFACRKAEIWTYDENSGDMGLFTGSTGRPISVESSDAGIPGYVLTGGGRVSVIHSNYHAAYNQKSDGPSDQSCLCIQCHHPVKSINYAIVLRDKRFPHFFSDQEERTLSELAPVIISALNASEVVESSSLGIEQSKNIQQRLESLLGVAQIISGQLNIDNLIPTIMNKACDLVNADRCSLFLVSDNREKLVTSFQSGVKDSIEIPINSGIVGHTATTGQILNIRDAYEDPRFNRSTDLATGYRTHNILCVPIYDDKKVLRGVTEMINKKVGYFTEDDIKSIQVMNIFVQLSLENAHLYHASLELSLQLRKILEISHSLGAAKTRALTESILQNSRQVIGARRAMLFLVNVGDDHPTMYATDEDIESKLRRMKQDSYAQQIGAMNKKLSAVRKMLAGQAGKSHSGENDSYSALVLSVMRTRTCSIMNNPQVPEESLIAVPVMNEGVPMGTLIMQWEKNDGPFTKNHQNLLESFAVFISISIEKDRMHATNSMVELKRQEVMSNEESDLFITPERLRIGSDAFSRIAVYEQTEIGRIKICFGAFDQFELRQQFGMSNRRLFALLYSLSSISDRWLLSVETVRFAAGIIAESGLIFPKEQLAALFLAALSSHIGGDPGVIASFFTKWPLASNRATLLFQIAYQCEITFPAEMWKLILELLEFQKVGQEIKKDDPLLSLKMILQVSSIGRAVLSPDDGDSWIDATIEEGVDKESFVWKTCIHALKLLETCIPCFRGIEEEGRACVQERDEK